MEKTPGEKEAGDNRDAGGKENRWKHMEARIKKLKKITENPEKPLAKREYF